ncbi:Oidioi.mRNA.OKI2018_I69.XSR.g16748.t1.cds [Oikopleura dioica]|uniref:Oidioi.mRNA.OKI2018_I69.XSR.g16748.t1.cds n=1 Tax=Oikopleura dioica TaxID=34765 RepID=A0ABN7SL06_OIKDI|nr:Oidioi.mRNA.OKI2018_I69.XSR.g16748.t1.cds [Oikopleura dioica]
MSEEESIGKRYVDWKKHIPKEEPEMCFNMNSAGGSYVTMATRISKFIYDGQKVQKCVRCKGTTDIMWRLDKFDLCSECYEKHEPNSRFYAKPYRIGANFRCPSTDDDKCPPVSFFEWKEGVCCEEAVHEQNEWFWEECLEEENLHDRFIPSQIAELKKIEDETKFLEHEAEVAKIKSESAEARLAAHLKKKRMAKRRLSRILIDAGKSLIEKENTKKG